MPGDDAQSTPPDGGAEACTGAERRALSRRLPWLTAAQSTRPASRRAAWLFGWLAGAAAVSILLAWSFSFRGTSEWVTAVAVGAITSAAGNWITGSVAAAVRKGREVTIGPAAPVEVSVKLSPSPMLVTGRAAGSLLDAMTITLLVEAGADQAVILLNLRVLIGARRRPPGGDVAVPLAALPARTFLIDLDEAHPRPVPETGTPVFPYAVSRADPEQFVIEASTRRYDVEWRLAFDWTCQGQHGTKIIDWHGHPFRVVAAPKPTRIERARLAGG